MSAPDCGVAALVTRWETLFVHMLNEGLSDAELRPMAAEMSAIEADVAATPAIGLEAIYPKLWLALETDDVPPESAAYSLIASALADIKLLQPQPLAA
jgi:hypothetical protein